MGEISLWPLAALYLGAMNLISFCAMGWDKGQARRRGRRAAECGAAGFRVFLFRAGKNALLVSYVAVIHGPHRIP